MDEVEGLIEQLKSENLFARINAAERLGEIKNKMAVPALIERLEDEDVNVRLYAAWALGKIGVNDEQLEEIRGMLKDGGNWKERQGAVFALGDLRDASAVPVLIGRLKDKDEDVRLRLNAAEALWRIGDVSAVPVLIERLTDEYKHVRYKAAEALGKIGGASAVAALIERLRDKDSDVQESAVIGLEEIVYRCKTLEKLGEVEKGINKASAALRKGRIDKGSLIGAQIKLAKLTSRIAKRKNELAPKRDLLLDGKPKPPKKGRGTYQTVRRTISR